jgi:hypothetical protein
MWQANSDDVNQRSALKFKAKFEERIPASLPVDSMAFLKTVTWHFTVESQGLRVPVPVLSQDLSLSRADLGPV